MNSLQMVELKQKHLAAGRLAAVIRVNDFDSPVSVDAGDYVLVMASEKPTVALDTVRACSHRKGIYLIAGEGYLGENAAIGAFPCATVPVKLLTPPDRFETMAAWTSRWLATSPARPRRVTLV